MSWFYPHPLVLAANCIRIENRQSLLPFTYFGQITCNKPLTHTGVKTNALNILHEIIKKANLQVKTPLGVSDRKEINDVIMEGETISSIVCTSTIDKIFRDCKFKGYEY